MKSLVLRKTVSILMVLVFTLVFLVGCGTTVNKSDNQKSAATAEGTKESVNSAATKETASEPVTLRFAWWGGEDRHKATLDAIAAYMKKNPNVKIEADYMARDGYEEKITTQLAGGTLPDLVQMIQARVDELVTKTDVFTNLYDYSDLLDISGFDEKFLKAHSVNNGKLVSMPTGQMSISIFYNKALLDKDKLDLDLTAGYDWDKFLNEGKKVNQLNKDQYFLMSDFQFYMYLVRSYVEQKVGGPFITDDYNIAFDRNSMLEALTYFKRLFDEKVAEPMEYAYTTIAKTDEDKKWGSGDICSFIQSASMSSLYKNTNVNELAVGNFPVMKDAKQTGIIVLASNVISVINNKGGRNSNVVEAVKFLNWFLNDDESVLLLRDVRGVPANLTKIKLLQDNNKLDKIYSDAVNLAVKNIGISESLVGENSEIFKIFQDILQELSFNKITPEAATDKMIQSLNQKLDEFKKK